MFSRHVLTVGALLSLVTAVPALAQADEGPAIVVYGQGGGFNALADLNDPGTADFNTGFNVGGGVAYQINPYVALRGNFTFARATARDPQSSAINEVEFNRFFYDGDVQVRYPFQNGLAPYAFIGGGGVTIDPSGSATQSFTKGAGKAGIGVSYELPRTQFGVYAEGSGWVYKWDRLGYDKTQFDLTWSSGVSYRFNL